MRLRASAILISIHAPHAGRDLGSLVAADKQIISIHAPHAGRDARTEESNNAFEISIHAPHAGRDHYGLVRRYVFHYFNPRAPCGARLSSEAGITRRWRYFNPRAPCGARPETYAQTLAQYYFNPRAPCGARPRGMDLKSRLEYFNPRAPCGARPSPALTLDPRDLISIHAPHAGRDDRRA